MACREFWVIGKISPDGLTVRGKITILFRFGFEGSAAGNAAVF